MFDAAYGLPKDSDLITKEYLDRFVIEWRFLEIGSEPSTECTLFGRRLSTPIMCGGMAFYEHLQEGGAPLFAEGVKAADTVMFIGMSSAEQLEEVAATGVPCGRIIKPFEDENLIIENIKHDERMGAIAVAMDIDHTFKRDGSVDDFFGNKLKVQTRDSLRRYVECSSLPFYPKGVLSVRDAEICAEAGVAGIIISHHQAMFPESVPPLKVLPKIREAVGDKLEIIVDCGFYNGYDCFKALALGADGVFVARPLRDIFKEKGAEGVTAKINLMTSELKACLARTGSTDIHHIDPEVIVEL